MNQTATHLLLGFKSLSQKTTFKQITIDLTDNEAKKLEEYCDKIGKSESDVIGKLIQELPGT
ncbi:MAG: CopG family transcriptional regulator [Rhizonema sp. PD37]|nr:CopG family transcriptional regulator [Rhizonema sp. PD37]